jgi:hypothetical protein
MLAFAGVAFGAAAPAAQALTFNEYNGNLSPTACPAT